jgi:hypothetical protein
MLTWLFAEADFSKLAPAREDTVQRIEYLLELGDINRTFFPPTRNNLLIDHSGSIMSGNNSLQ